MRGKQLRQQLQPLLGMKGFCILQLEELKAVLRVCLQLDDLGRVLEILHRGSGQSLLINLLLCRVRFQDKSDQEKFDALKFVLEGEPFETAQTFAEVFTAAVLGQKDASFEGVGALLDLVLHSHLYRKPKVLKSLVDLPLIDWPKHLHQELIQETVERNGYGQADEKQKQKLVQLLSNLRERRGQVRVGQSGKMHDLWLYIYIYIYTQQP